MENKNICSYYNNCNHKDCEADFCIRKYKLDYLYNSSLLSEKQRHYTKLFIDDNGTDLAEFNLLADIEKNITQFVTEGKNLYLHSHQCGNGKTSWAVRLLQSYLNEIWPAAGLECRVLFVNVPRFLTALKDNISKKNDYAEYIKENILDADIVVFDDISHHVGTDYEISNLLSIIDSRISLGKSNIYTSNLTAQETTNTLGARLASRLARNAVDIELHGADKSILLGGAN